MSTLITDNEQYFALFSCNEWKQRSSMAFLGVFTEQALRKKLAKEIKVKNMLIDKGINIDTCDTNDFNSILSYGFVQELQINEEL